MGHNQNPHAHVRKKNKKAVPDAAVVNSEGYFAPSKSNTEALNEVKGQ